MGKKEVLIAIGAVLVIAIIFVIVLILKPEYSDDPKTWIEEKDGIKHVSTDKVTKGKGYFDDTTEQYKDINSYIETAFSYDGIYQGNGFFKERYYARAGEMEKLVMEITPDLNSTDGILQGIIIERVQEGVPKAFIFLDEDWKKQFPELYVVWGAEYQNEKRFAFTEIREGVYMDQVIDDKDRFTSESYSGVTFGGVIVGDLSRENILNANPNGTLIMLT